LVAESGYPNTQFFAGKPLGERTERKKGRGGYFGRRQAKNGLLVYVVRV